MATQILTTLLLSVLISGCASSVGQLKTAHNKPILMSNIYAKSVGDAANDTAKFVEENLKESKTFGYVKPYVPVVQGPVVRKVWVPDHKSTEDPSVLVGGHWVYLMIEGPKWFTEAEKNDTGMPIITPMKPNVSS
jgi:hypothetical protein